jgi:hypothetical protein
MKCRSAGAQECRLARHTGFVSHVSCFQRCLVVIAVISVCCLGCIAISGSCWWCRWQTGRLAITNQIRLSFQASARVQDIGPTTNGYTLLLLLLLLLDHLQLPSPLLTLMSTARQGDPSGKVDVHPFPVGTAKPIMYLAFATSSPSSLAVILDEA